jgi:hypothetical protein
VDYISRVVDSDPEAARKLAEMAARGQKVEVLALEPLDPSLTAAEVEERLTLFDKVVEEVLRDLEGVENMARQHRSRLSMWQWGQLHHPTDTLL